MKKSIKIAINALAIAALILMGGVARNVYQKYTSEQQHVKDLERQLSELSKKEKQIRRKSSFGDSKNTSDSERLPEP